MIGGLTRIVKISLLFFCLFPFAGLCEWNEYGNMNMQNGGAE